LVKFGAEQPIWGLQHWIPFAVLHPGRFSAWFSRHRPGFHHIHVENSLASTLKDDFHVEIEFLIRVGTRMCDDLKSSTWN